MSLPSSLHLFLFFSCLSFTLPFRFILPFYIYLYLSLSPAILSLLSCLLYPPRRLARAGESLPSPWPPLSFPLIVSLRRVKGTRATADKMLSKVRVADESRACTRKCTKYRIRSGKRFARGGQRGEKSGICNQRRLKVEWLSL